MQHSYDYFNTLTGGSMSDQPTPQTVNDFLNDLAQWDRPGFDLNQILLLDLR